MDRTLSLLEVVFAHVLQTSWQAAVLVALVLLTQAALGKALADRWRYLLWSVVLLRLLIPVTPPSPFSLFNLARAPRSQAPPGNALHRRLPPARFAAHHDKRRSLQGSPFPGGAWEREAYQNASAPLPRAPATTPKPVRVTEGDSTMPPESIGDPADVPLDSAPVVSRSHSWWGALRWWSIAASIWMCGCVLFGMRMVVGCSLIARRMAELEVVEDGVAAELLRACQQEMGVGAKVRLVVTNENVSPALWGLFRPHLVVPRRILQSFQQKELRHVFLHELAHLRRCDLLLNLLLAAVQVVHWFNPLLWWALRRLREDRELACDALALAHCRPDETRQYGRTVIKLLETLCTGRPWPASVGLLGRRSSMKRRIASIGRYQKPSRWLTVGQGTLTMALILLLGAVGLTSAVSKAPADADEPTTVASPATPTTQTRVVAKETSEPAVERSVEREIKPVKERPPVYGLTFSPDNKWLAAATGTSRKDGGPVLLWRAPDWKRREIKFEPKGAGDVAFSPDGKLLAYGAWDNRAVITLVPSGMVVHTLEHPAGVAGVAFTPDGDSLATACLDGNAYVWNVETGKQTQTIAGHENRVYDVDTAKGPMMGDVLLVTGSSDDTSKLWKLNTGELLRTTKPSGSTVRRCAFSADGRYYLTAGSSRGRLRDVQSGETRVMIEGVSGCFQLSNDKRLLAVASWNRDFRVYRINLSEPTERQDVQIRSLLNQWKDDRYAVREAASQELVDIGLAAAPALRKAIRSTDAEVRIRARTAYLKIRSPAPIATLTGDFGRAEVVCFSPDSKLLVGGCREGLLKVWETSEFRELATLTK